MKRGLHPATLVLAAMLAIVPHRASAQQADLDRCLAALDKAQGAIDRASTQLRNLERCPAAPPPSTGAPDDRRLREAQEAYDRLALDVARQRLGDLLKASGCAEVRLETAGGGRMRLSGQSARRRELAEALAALRRDFPNLQIDDSAVGEAGPCGDRLDDKHVILKSGDGFQQARREQVRAQGGNRVPRAEECADLGAKIEALRDSGRTNLPDRFWVLRQGGSYEQPIYDLCGRRDDGSWDVTDHNLTGQAPLVLRSGT
jgi:hypothetical protein